MLFNSLEFWLFFIPVLALVHLLPHRGQNILLLVGSYVFYGAWDWRFLSLIFISTLVDYLAAPFAVPGRSQLLRRLAVTTSVTVNLGILGFFKYHNFFVQSFIDLFGISQGSTDELLLSLILPVGISFYTFQTMSYTFDVHSGKMRPVRSFLDFALYVAFFPQLVAGPIERASRLVPQIVNRRHIEPSRLESGCHLIAWGLCKKVFIADSIALPVNIVYASADPTGPEVYVATVAFAVQIYCDFSGYTDIARGTARLLGVELMLNFNLPYIAQNPSDFWRRWHISLSTWLRDYLYFPLGGSRHGEWATYRNITITMVLGGLWHGARYNFVLWGLFHGGILAIHRIITGGNQNLTKTDSLRLTVVKVFCMFHLTLFGWLLFRVENMSQFDRMAMAFVSPWEHWGSAFEILKYIAPFVLPLIVVQIWQGLSRDLEVFTKAAWPLRATFFGFCVLAVSLFSRGTGTPFIYFQF